MNRPQQEGGTADPVGKCRAVEIDPLAGIDLGLPVERKMVGIFGDQHLGDGRLGRQATLDQARRCWRLHHDVLAGPAGIFGPAHHQHAELRRHDVEPLAHILADPVQVIPAARAGLVVEIDGHLDARQMGGKRAPVPAARGGAGAAFAGRRLFILGLAAGFNLLGLLEPEQQLVFREGFGASAKAMALQLLDDLFEPLGTRPLRQDHCLERRGIVRERIRQDRHQSE